MNVIKAHYVCSYCWMKAHEGTRDFLGPWPSAPFTVPATDRRPCCFCSHESDRWTLIQDDKKIGSPNHCVHNPDRSQ